MSVLRSVILALVYLGGVAAASPAVYESHSATAVTEGEVTVATDPDTAYRAAVDYERWSQIFPNVRRAIVTSRRGNEARVTFVHSDGTRDQLHFRNRPATRTLWFERIGGPADVWGEIAFRAADARTRLTRVHSRLYANVHGFRSMFVSHAELRRLRQKQVRDDLTHLQVFFARR